MNKELVVLTAAFALAAGVVFAQEMKKADNAAVPAVAAAPAKAVQDMNAEATNAQAADAEDMNAQAADTEDMNAQAADTEDMNAQAADTEDMNAQAPVKDAPAKADPAAAPSAQPKY